VMVFLRKLRAAFNSSSKSLFFLLLLKISSLLYVGA
jgi:hypothetical protein